MRRSLVILGALVTIGCGSDTHPWQPSTTPKGSLLSCTTRRINPSTMVLECEPARLDIQPISGPGGNIVWGT